MLDVSRFQMGGPAVLAMFIYGVASVFGTGQIIGHRMIVKSGWIVLCKKGLSQTRQRQIEQSRLPVNHMPSCKALTGILGINMPELCATLDDLRDQLQSKLPDLSVDDDPAQPGVINDVSNACHCAKAKWLSEHKIDLGLHAGSWRLISPPVVSDFPGSVAASLRHPACQFEEVGS